MVIKDTPQIAIISFLIIVKSYVLLKQSKFNSLNSKILFELKILIME